MAIATTHLYEFSPFRLDPAERRLMREGEPVALTPKCFDLLAVLVENSGHGQVLILACLESRLVS